MEIHIHFLSTLTGLVSMTFCPSKQALIFLVMSRYKKLYDYGVRRKRLGSGLKHVNSSVKTEVPFKCARPYGASLLVGY